MDWLDRMNSALDYIENNLTEEIDYAVLASKVYCSAYNFRRMFSFLTDISLSDYIRRRRLTMAAFELQHSDIKIIDLALKYGYDSPVSFGRAFRSVHGITPSSARSESVMLKAYPKISFHLFIKGDVVMDYRIEKREAFSIVGAKFSAPSDTEENFKIVPKIWNEARKTGLISELAAICGVKETDAISLTANIAGKVFDFYIAVESETNQFPPKFEKLKIPRQHGEFLQRTVKCRRQVKTCGGEFLPNGFPQRIMN